jgi:hypothetical protein
MFSLFFPFYKKMLDLQSSDKQVNLQPKPLRYPLQTKLEQILKKAFSHIRLARASSTSCKLP